MKIKLVVIFVLFLNSKIFSQDIYYKVEYGKGSATASDVYLQMKLDNFLVEIEAKRLKSTIRDMDMEISTNIDGYDYWILEQIVTNKINVLWFLDYPGTQRVNPSSRTH